MLALGLSPLSPSSPTITSTSPTTTTTTNTTTSRARLDLLVIHRHTQTFVTVPRCFPSFLKCKAVSAAMTTRIPFKYNDTSSIEPDGGLLTRMRLQQKHYDWLIKELKEIQNDHHDDNDIDNHNDGSDITPRMPKGVTITNMVWPLELIGPQAPIAFQEPEAMVPFHEFLPFAQITINGK
jgi:hypothetical protein